MPAAPREDPFGAMLRDLRNPGRFGVSRLHGGHAMPIYAAAVALGIIIARQFSASWLLAATLCAGVLVLIVGLSIRVRYREWALVVAIACSAAAWAAVRQQHIARHDLAASLSGERQLIRARGRIITPPEYRARSSGEFARFDFRDPITRLHLSLTALHGSDNAFISCTGTVLVHINDTVHDLHVGDTVDVIGLIRRPGPPLNPGNFDFQRYARDHGIAGLLNIASRGGITRVADHSPALTGTLRRARAAARARTSSWLLDDLPESRTPDRDALLAALMLGARDPALDGLMQSFQHLGIAHLLAISGLHLGILAGLIIIVARLLRLNPTATAILIIMSTLLYLFVIDVRMPVLRAGIMTIAASIGLVGARRINVASLVAISAIIILIWQPDQIENAGFQLSYGVVFALIYLVTPVRTRWFRPHDNLAPSIPAMLWQRFATAFTVAVIAWLIATPIAMYHFGIIALAGVPLTLLLVPLVTIILVIGSLKIIIAAVLPSMALLLGYPLAWCADVMVFLAQSVESWPGMYVATPFPPLLWVVGFLLTVVTWSLAPRGPWLRANRVALAAASIIGCAPMLVPPVAPALRIDMISVGDGTAMLQRSGNEAVLFDAGSISNLRAGRDQIIPALKSLGVPRLSTLIISHANLDHYAATLDLVRGFTVDQVIITPQFHEYATDEPRSGPALVLDHLHDADIPIHTVAANDTRHLGAAHLTWLHPDATDNFTSDNDHSMVILIEVAGRRVLLTGDIQDLAIDVLRARWLDPGTDILELPHHGSYRDAAVRFVNELDPRIILQSTGRRRLENDRWPDVLPAHTQRYITARDGMSTVIIERDGTIRSFAFRQPDH